jgi:CBS domain-containing protein
MTATVACCAPHSPLEAVAKLMVQHHCGEIPVADENSDVVGVVTDRDIVCRVVAQGKNPLAHTAEHCMSQPAMTVRGDVTLAVVMATIEATPDQTCPGDR